MPTQDGQRSADDIFKRILFNESVTTQLQILLDLSLSVQLTIHLSIIGLDDDLAPIRRKAIT